MKKAIILLSLIFQFFSGQIFAKEIAITFDDLPVNRSLSVEELDAVTDRILNGLDKQDAKAIGFVNEKKLYENGDEKARTSILKRWTERGHLLGNHTYSHISLNDTPLEEYEEDVRKGGHNTKKIMHESGLRLKYFRHPYLHTGLTPEIRNNFKHFLDKEGYTIAPATIDTDDWVFDKIYVEALAKNDLKGAATIRKGYLQHTQNKFEFYDKATSSIFSRDISQIWLLHTNSINADVIDDLLQIAINNGYSFISLEKALQDPAYNTKDSYYEDFGISWLYRWDYSNGLKVDWEKEPKSDVFSEENEIQRYDAIVLENTQIVLDDLDHNAVFPATLTKGLIYIFS